MPFKDIVVFVDSSSASSHRLRVAADLARRYAAHLIGVYVVPGNIGSGPHDGFARGDLATREVLDRHRHAKERTFLQIGRHFAELARRDDIQAEFRLILDAESDQNVMLNSLYADLVIAGQADPDDEAQHSH